MAMEQPARPPGRPPFDQVQSAFGKKLLAWMEKNDLSRDAAASHLYVDRRTLLRWLKGEATPTKLTEAAVEQRLKTPIL